MLRLMRMRQLAVVCLLALSACGNSTAQLATDKVERVPEEFREACGKPGSRVVTERLEVRIKHSDCDLTGVTIENQGRALTVPEPGFGSSDSTGVTLEVDKATRDVTFMAEAEVAQY